MFKKVLIANRGEIAVRIIRCLREMGIKSVALYSDADRESLAVRWADQAVHLPGVASTETYMDMDKVIAAAKATGAEAIHPGYGFLSEKAEFPARCAKEGLTFIGPHADAISRMGDKMTARQIMMDANVPVTPGYQNEDDDIDAAYAAAEQMGYPVMLKASAGGGGKGMRYVDDPKNFRKNYEMARSEALNAFSDGRIYVEKFIVQPRHIEVQLACDKHGNAIHLGERECSIQRRHQKVIEEAPSPGVDAELRAKIGEVAVQAAKAVKYDSIGTVEFLMDADKNFYFMEMNTRLQVEHPVTEWVTGVDLVRLQIQIAAGMEMHLKQDDIKMHGHSIECRVYAEDPAKNFMPCPGVITGLSTPSGLGVRDDSGVYQGFEVPIHYDPMISKLTTWGHDREEAIDRMMRALGEYKVSGIKTNLWFHRRLMINEAFRKAELDTGFIANHPELFEQEEEAMKDMALVAAAIRHFQNEVKRNQAGAAKQGDGNANRWRDYARSVGVGRGGL